MRPFHSALALSQALEIMSKNSFRQLVWLKYDRMPTRPAAHLDMSAAGREKQIA
jgi:hypothetical protein